MWNTIFVEPLYNFLVILTNISGGYLFVGIIILTLIVRLVLSPLSIKALKAQARQQKLRPEMDKIKETIEDKTEQSKAIMELYKKNGANPFSGCLPVLLQIPIILALYQAFIGFAAGKPDLLYSTLQLSQNFTAMMGGVDLFHKSILVALLAGLTQYAQLSMSPVQVDDKDPQAGMQKALRLTMPVMITFFAAALPAAVALYWATSNVVTLIMERVVRARLH